MDALGEREAVTTGSSTSAWLSLSLLLLLLLLLLLPPLPLLLSPLSCSNGCLSSSDSPSTLAFVGANASIGRSIGPWTMILFPFGGTSVTVCAWSFCAAAATRRAAP